MFIANNPATVMKKVEQFSFIAVGYRSHIILKNTFDTRSGYA